MKIKLKRVFLGGDSAGGSLTCALTALILKNNLKIPNSIFLIYPSLDLRRIYYPSRNYFLKDTILSPALAIMAIKNYIKDNEAENNPLASPLLIT